MGKVFNMIDYTKKQIRLIEIRVISFPNKTEYYVGDTFDPAGLVVEAYYSDGSHKEISGYTWKPSGALTLSDTKIYIIYVSDNAEFKAAIDITVAKKKIKVPSQSGSLTYNGSSQAPSWQNYDANSILIKSGQQTAVNAGAYSVQFALKDPAGTEWEDGSISDKTVQWSIQKASGYIRVDTQSISVGETNGTIHITSSHGGGISVYSYNTNIATVSASNYTVTVTGVKTGSTVISIECVETTNYTSASVAISVSVKMPTWTLLHVYTYATSYTPDEDMTIKAVLIGAGGSGMDGAKGPGGAGGNGGGPGEVILTDEVNLTKGTTYKIFAGLGGNSAENQSSYDGQSTSAFGYTALGGKCGEGSPGGTDDDVDGKPTTMVTYNFPGITSVASISGAGGGRGNNPNATIVRCGKGGSAPYGDAIGGKGADQYADPSYAYTGHWASGYGDGGGGGGGGGSGYTTSSIGEGGSGGNGAVYIFKKS